MSQSYPKLMKIHQHFPRPIVADIAQSMREEIEKILRHAKITAGKKIGLTVGSRGIQNIVPMLQTAVQCVRAIQAEPIFLVAMGSHGGGTEKGQREYLASLGITEQSMDAPIWTCIKGREIGKTATNLQAYMLESAFAVDAIIPINRIKTHTSFKGDVESGLFKKLVVGLGGPEGAQQFHSQGKATMLSPLLKDVGKIILERMPIIGGIGIIENAYEETALIKAILPETFFNEERDLLLYSKTLMPSLPVTNLDALIVEEISKTFSGTGMDTNIVGRLGIQGEPEPEDPFIRYIAVWDLAEVSHGNACGIGLADFTTQKLVDKIDKKPTYLNCLTTTFPRRAHIPLHLETEKEVLETMLTCLQGTRAPKDVRLVVVPNTLFLTECFVSEALLPELQEKSSVEYIGELQDISFDTQGNMHPRLSL